MKQTCHLYAIPPSLVKVNFNLLSINIVISTSERPSSGMSFHPLTDLVLKGLLEVNTLFLKNLACNEHVNSNHNQGFFFEESKLCPEYLRHKLSVIHPKVLTDSGIAVHKTTHRAGEVSGFVFETNVEMR